MTTPASGASDDLIKKQRAQPEGDSNQRSKAALIRQRNAEAETNQLTDFHLQF